MSETQQDSAIRMIAELMVILEGRTDKVLAVLDILEKELDIYQRAFDKQRETIRAFDERITALEAFLTL